MAEMDGGTAMVRRFGLVMLATVVVAAGWSGAAVAKGGGDTIPAPLSGVLTLAT